MIHNADIKNIPAGAGCGAQLVEHWPSTHSPQISAQYCTNRQQTPPKAEMPGGTRDQNANTSRAFQKADKNKLSQARISLWFSLLNWKSKCNAEDCFCVAKKKETTAPAQDRINNREHQGLEQKLHQVSFPEELPRPFSLANPWDTWLSLSIS